MKDLDLVSETAFIRVEDLDEKLEAMNKILQTLKPLSKDERMYALAGAAITLKMVSPDVASYVIRCAVER